MKNTADQLKATIKSKAQFLKFLFVGIFLFVIDFGVTLFAYYAFGLGPGIASATGFMAGFVVGFYLNKNFVFKHSKNSRFSMPFQIILYLLLSFFNLITSSFAIEFMVNKGVIIEIAKPIMVGIIAVWNFLIFKYYVFSYKK